MKLIKTLALSLAINVFLSFSAFATVIQYTAPASSFDRNWSSTTLGTVIFADGTNSILGLTSTVTIRDQGWGGQDPNNNQVVIGLFNNNSLVWASHVAGGYHNWTTQTFDITDYSVLFTNLNLALQSVNWGMDPTLTMRMYTSTIGYPGWSLSTQNASFAVTSTQIPLPGTIALLGLGLTGLIASRRKHTK